jgi:hypothetical protein
VRPLKTYQAEPILVAILVVTLFSTCVVAQEETASSRDEPVVHSIKDKIGLSGSIRFGYWSSTRNLDGEQPIGSAMLWVKANHQLSSRFSYFADGWLASRGPVDKGESRVEGREAYIELKTDRFELRVGRQIFAWGRADAINPTANLSGEDLTLLTPETEDRKRGTTAIRGRYFLHSLSITGVWLPEFRPVRFPFPNPPTGETYLQDYRRWPADQFAFRVEQTGSTVDWSVSYFDGFDLLPDLAPAKASNDFDAIKLSHHRIRVIGADMATNIGHYGLRAEGSYTSTEDSSHRDPFIKNPYVFAVLGGDRTYRGELNVNLQYLLRVVIDYTALPNGGRGPTNVLAEQEAVISDQAERVEHGMSTRISNKWLHETLEAEFAAVTYFSPKGVLVRPKIAYSVTDHWKLVIGGELFRGDKRSVFGLLRQNSVSYCETRYSF